MAAPLDASSLQPKLLRALADPRRLAIVAQLASASEAQTVSALTQCCGIDFSGVSRHLKVLHEAGVVSVKRDGRQAFYRLDCDAVAGALEDIAGRLRSCC